MFHGHFSPEIWRVSGEILGFSEITDIFGEVGRMSINILI